MPRPAPLPPAALRPACDPAALPFETTAELEAADGMLGQERAVEALEFALGLRHQGYNAFVIGPEGVGRRHLVMALLRKHAATAPVPPDQVYVYAFDKPVEPRALLLPAGRGTELRADLDHFVQEVGPAVTAAFESEDHLARRRAVDEHFEALQQGRIAEIQAEADKRGIGVLTSPTGIALVPLVDGKPVPPDAIDDLPEDQQRRLKQALDETREQVASTLRMMPRWAREHQAQVRDVERSTTVAALDHLLGELRERWADQPEVLAWLDALREDALENRQQLRGEEGPARTLAALTGEPIGDDWLRRYQVNVLVDRSKQEGAPVIYEDYPTLPNLVGRVEYRARLGTLVTDFSLIRPGALHRANGGYLVLEARKLLTQPASWDQLKRVLRSGEIRIESLAQALALSSTTSLEPQPVPLDLKLVLVGDRRLYALLAAYDPELQSYFKVPAELDEVVDRDEERVLGFAKLLGALAADEGLRPLSRRAVARLVEESSRMAGDGEKLSTHIRDLVDLLHESDHFAEAAGRDTVEAEDVRTAVDQDRRRRGRLRERMLEAELRGHVRVQTEGRAVGQVNGLSVVPAGRAPFGRPTRITARVQLGAKGVIDIEREVELSGPIHAKGVLILGGFIGARYAPEVPLAFTASLVFEQSYGGVEGDSASLAETLALLSALGELPLRQALAVTGAVDQHGNVEAVGGVNEKIEGFFELCAARGLTGEQGVVVPRANLAHLVLHDEVVAAVREERFAIWAVDTVDEALELLTGLPAGQRGEDGAWPEGSANARVEARLVSLAEQAKAWAAHQADGGPAGAQRTRTTE